MTLLLPAVAVAGDPDLYIGSDVVNTTKLPTSATGTYIWRAAGLSTDVVTVTRNDAGACRAFFPCNYYVGVYGYSRNASYTLLVRTQAAGPTPLMLGTPVVDSIADTTSPNYYVLQTFPWDAGVLVITVTPEYGTPGMQGVVMSVC